MQFNTIHTAYGMTALLPFGVIPALLAVVVAAIGKEVWHAQGHGTPDVYDAPFFVSLQTGVFR